MKTEYDEDQGAALVESNEEAVELRSTAHSRWQRNTQRLFLWDRPANGSAKAGRTETSRRANGECQDCWSKGSRGTRFPLAELRGGSLLSGCWGEASGAGRGQGPAQLSVGNRHLTGYYLPTNTPVSVGSGAGATHDFQERSSCL